MCKHCASVPGAPNRVSNRGKIRQFTCTACGHVSLVQRGVREFPSIYCCQCRKPTPHEMTAVMGDL